MRSLIANALGDAGIRGSHPQLLLPLWEEVVGSAIAKHCRPSQLEGSTLTVSCDHPSWRSEVELRESEILQALIRRSSIRDLHCVLSW